MKKISLGIVLTVACWYMVSGQKPELKLTFTAENNTSHAQLDSIKIMNGTKGCDTLLVYPDTVLIMNYNVGVNEYNDNDHTLFLGQNYPNPVNNSTNIRIHLNHEGTLYYYLSDTEGRILFRSENFMEKGTHVFNYIPGPGTMSFFTAILGSEREDIKIVHTAATQSRTAQLTYVGLEEDRLLEFKTRWFNGFMFDPGDTLIYSGFVDGIESAVMEQPMESDTVIFQLATGIACPGMQTITYGGQVYNTVQIFNQCWLKENLNIGTRISSWGAPQNNGVIEKYCYDDNPDNCDIYGALYGFQEMMDYYPVPGSKGICPEGWHVPTHDDFMMLEAAADSIYGVGDPIWEETGFRGYDAGHNLKSSQGWAYNGNGTDKYGFSGEPGGLIGWNEFSMPEHNGFYNLGIYWSSHQAGQPPFGWYRHLNKSYSTIGRAANNMPVAASVRCIRDY